jgi:hypothetical protein
MIKKADYRIDHIIGALTQPQFICPEDGVPACRNDRSIPQ